MTDLQVWDLRRESVTALEGKTIILRIAEGVGLAPEPNASWDGPGWPAAPILNFLSGRRLEMSRIHDDIVSGGFPDGMFFGELLQTPLQARRWQVVHFTLGAISTIDEIATWLQRTTGAVSAMQLLRLLSDLEGQRNATVFASGSMLASQGLNPDP